jgi:ubiquinone biosynthesis protein
MGPVGGLQVMIRWPGYILSFLSISIVGLGAAVVYAAGRLGTLFIVDKQSRRRSVSRLGGRVLRWTMTLLGATFIKLGQVMSTRPDLFSQEFLVELRKLQDQLPAFAFRHVRDAVLTELKLPIREIFLEFDRTPVAAASIAQVHRARLMDGTEVAVKVVRPRIRRKIERDAVILELFARVLLLSAKMRHAQPIEHLEEFIDGILAQTDLSIEARNYEIFHENFRTFPGVHFPEVYADVSSSSVLTMEFVHGVKVDELEPESHPNLGPTLRDMFLKMCFEDGFLHADLHPGNMLITAEGQLYVFDVGLIKRLDEDVLVKFIDFTKCVVMGTTKDFVEHLQRFHRYMDDVDWESLEHDAEILALQFRGQSTSELEWGGFINELFIAGRRHGVRPMTELALVMVGLITAEGIGKMLSPNANSFEEVASFIMPILARRGLTLSNPVVSATYPES